MVLIIGETIKITVTVMICRRLKWKERLTGTEIGQVSTHKKNLQSANKCWSTKWTSWNKSRMSWWKILVPVYHANQSNEYYIT